VISLFLNLIFFPALFFEATKYSSLNGILDFSKISIVYLPTFPDAPIIAQVHMISTLF